MPEAKPDSSAQAVMRQIRDKQAQLLPGASRGRWRLDVSVPVLAAQGLLAMAVGLLVSIGLYVILFYVLWPG